MIFFHTKRQRRKEVLKRWWKWLPALAAWFFVLFFEAWLNDERWKNDYEYWNLLQEYRAAEQELRAVQVEEARLETLDRLDLHAQALGLRESDPGQIEVLGYDAASEIKRFEQAAVLAKAPVLAPQGISGAVLAPLSGLVSEQLMPPLATLGNEIEQMASEAALAVSTPALEAAPPVAAPTASPDASTASLDESLALLSGSI